jgi:uncharacterized protein YggL (DUF469 family)
MTGACPRFGYHVEMDIRPDVAPSARDELLDTWSGFLERRGLYCGGGGAERLQFVVASEASQATESDRAATRAWLASRREISASRVGDLEDLDQAL